MAFGKEIKRLRKQANLSAEDMAAILGIDKPTRYSGWEQRDRDPKKKEDIESIEKKFQKTLAEIQDLESLPDYLKSKETTYDIAHAPGLAVEGIIEAIAGNRVILSVLAEVQAPAQKELTLPTQLLSIYQKMVKDESLKVEAELKTKMKLKT